MKRQLAHLLMKHQWLCSKQLHGRIPFAPWCLYAWAVEECGMNHPEEWEEVGVEVKRPLMVIRPARVVGQNIYVSTDVTVTSGTAAKILNATVRGPIA